MWWRRIWILTKRTYLAYLADNCSQLAAAISFYVLFSILPLAIFTLSIFGLFLSGDEVRREIVNRVLDTVPLTQTEGRSAVEDAVENIASANISGPIAALGFLGTLWTASAVFSSIRRSLNIIWRVEEHRPWAQGKLVDFMQVGMLSAILVASLVLTGILRTIREVSAEHVGPLSNGNPLWEVPAILIPAVLTFATFLLVYRTVPAARVAWRDVVPGAIVATLLFEVLKNSFAFYIANFGNFDVVYGSLAGVLLFLFYTFLSSNILLIGAELSHTFERYHLGELDSEIYPTAPMPTVATRAFRAVKGLFVRQ